MSIIPCDPPPVQIRDSRLRTATLRIRQDAVRDMAHLLLALGLPWRRLPRVVAHLNRVLGRPYVSWRPALLEVAGQVHGGRVA